MLFTASAGLCEGSVVLPALHFAQFFAPAPSGCEMSPLSTACAHSHSLNADVKEHKSGQKAENHPQHPAVPGSARLHRTDVPLLWVASLSPPTPSSVSEVRELYPACPAGCCCGRSAFYTAFFQALGKKKRQILTCTFIPLLPSVIFVNCK